MTIHQEVTINKPPKAAPRTTASARKLASLCGGTAALFLAVSVSCAPRPESAKSQLFAELIRHALESGAGAYELATFAPDLDALEAVNLLLLDGFHLVDNPLLEPDVVACFGGSLQRLQSLIVLTNAGQFPFERFGFNMELEVDDECHVLNATGYVASASVP